MECLVYFDLSRICVTYRYFNIIIISTGKAVPFVELTVAHASVLTILAISFERYYAICEPLKAGYVCTKARALMICLAAWVVAALFTRYDMSNMMSTLKCVRVCSVCACSIGEFAC